MKDKDLKKLQAAILEVIRIQLRDDQPPETRITLERLISEGFSEQEAMGLIGHVVALEIIGLIQDCRQYNEVKYVKALSALPELPGKK